MADADKRYQSALHAVQSGIAYEMGLGSKDTHPKHLRTGVNAAMCDHTALVRLLVDKGVITSEEYLEAIAGEMEREQERYERRNGVSFA